MLHPDLPDDDDGAAATPGPVLAQAAFNASWDLLTRWRRGDRVRAASYLAFLGPDGFAIPEVIYALFAAEARACREAAEPVSIESLEWLYAVLPGKAEVFSLLVDQFASDEDGAPINRSAEYPYLLPPEQSDELGRLGHFRVLREIGRGGMGVVFEVEVANTVLSNSHALKLLEPTRNTPEAKRRFIREARAMDKIAHPNIVRIYSAAALNDITYIEMEYVYGPSLDELIRHHLGNPVPLSLAADLIRQAASGLAAAHDHPSHLAHRDVKPGNILLQWVLEDESYPFGWQVRVCDFGLVTEADQTALTEKGFLVGSPPYLAPEQFMQPMPGESRDGRMSDMFALGSITYQLVTGGHPFMGDTKAATVGNIERCQPKPPRQVNAEIPHDLERLILNMLHRSPQQRPSAMEVAVGLSRLLGPRKPPGLTDQSWSEDSPGHPAAGETGKPLQRPTAPSPELAPLKLSLGVTVWKKEDTARGLSIEDPKALPLRAGDYARLEVRSNRPAYLYVVQLEASGDVAPLYPWQRYDWEKRGAEQPSERLDLPQNPLTDGVPLTEGMPGIEAFVVLAREGPLSEDQSLLLKGLFANGIKQGKLDPLRGPVWVGTDEERLGGKEDRARLNLDAARTVDDPVARVRRLLLSDEVCRLSKASRAVLYPFAGQ